MGPFVGELYWEGGRFAPMLPYMRQRTFKGKDYVYIILSREERFDLYGRNADILVPMRIEGDYINKFPECFRLQNFSVEEYEKLAVNFRKKYSEKYNIIKHVYPNIKKTFFLNKNQFSSDLFLYSYAPRKMNYEIVDEYLPKDEKPLVVLAPRFRKGFRRNWNQWLTFYDLLYNSKLLKEFNFILCGKKEEYQPDPHKRFLDMNDIVLKPSSSLVGVLLAILERAFFTFGSQSAIPNFSLLYKVDVLEFGCQRNYHTKVYNVRNTPITFFDNPKYDWPAQDALKQLEKLLKEKLKNVKSISSKK
jgi:hypothetical protein